MAGAPSTGTAACSQQPCIQQEPHIHEGQHLHPALIAAAPVSKRTGKNTDVLGVGDKH